MNEINIALIEQHLLGELSKEDVALVEKLLQQDEEARNYYEEQKLVHDAIIIQNLFELEKEVRNFEPTNAKGGAKNWFLGGLIVAVLAAGTLSLLPAEVTEESTSTQKVEQTKKVIASQPSSTEQSIRETETTISHNNTSENVDRSSVREESENVFIKASSIDSSVTASSSDDITVSTTDLLKQQTKIKIEEEQQAVTEKEMCDLTFKYKVQNTCSGKYDGSISITTVNNGELPFEYLLNGSSTSKTSKDLAAGYYNIQIIDNKGCVSEQEVIVEEKECIQDQDLAFSPNIAPFELDLFDSYQSVSIIDMNGEIVFKDTEINYITWDGTNLNEQLCPTGVYIIQLNGMNTEKIIYVTLLN